MPTPGLIQRSFAGGEIAEDLWARYDQARVTVGCRLCRNMLIARNGLAINRPGTQHVGLVKDSTRRTIIRPFIFSATEALLLEFGHLYMRIETLAARFVVDPVGWDTLATYIKGDVVDLGGLQYYSIKDGNTALPPDVTPSAWYLLEETATPGVAIFELPTPYTEDELDALQMEGSADIMVITHPNHPPMLLSRELHTSPAGPTPDPKRYCNSTLTSPNPTGYGSTLNFDGPVGTDNSKSSLSAGTVTRVDVGSAIGGFAGTKTAVYITGAGVPGQTPFSPGVHSVEIELLNCTPNGTDVNFKVSAAVARFNSSNVLQQRGVSTATQTVGDGVKAFTCAEPAGGWTAGSTGDRLGLLIDFVKNSINSGLFKIRLNDGHSWVTGPMFIVSPDQATQTTLWRLDVIAFKPSNPAPSGLAVSGGGGGGPNRWQVTAIMANSLEESLPGTSGAAVACTFTSNAVTAVSVLKVGHGFTTGDSVKIVSAPNLFTALLEGNTYTVTVVDADHFTLDTTQGYLGGTFSQTGTYAPPWVSAALVPSVGSPSTVTWSPVPGAIEYKIYRAVNDVFGNVGKAGLSSFVDKGVEPDVEDVPPRANNPFIGADNYPRACAFHGPRLWFASTINDPLRIWASNSANFFNLSYRSPQKDNDGMQFDMAGRRVDGIRHLLSLGELLILTSGSRWLAEPNKDGGIVPPAPRLKPQGQSGVAELRPLVIGQSALVLDAQQSIVRDLSYSFEANGFSGSDLTPFVTHLLEGQTIIDWAFAETPDPTVYLVRADGVLLTLTYMPEQQIIAWTRSDTYGNEAGTRTAARYRSVAAIPEEGRICVYFITERTVNGASKQHIERQYPRLSHRPDFDVGTDCLFSDDGLTYDGRNTDTGVSIKFSGGTTWAAGETGIALTATGGPVFAPSDVGNGYRITLANGTTASILVTAWTSTTAATGTLITAVPAALRNVFSPLWTHLIDLLTGFDHLKLQTLRVVADGWSFEAAVDGSGSLDISTPPAGFPLLFSVVHAGLGVTSDLRTLPVGFAGGSPDAIEDRKKVVPRVTMIVKNTRGIEAGPDEDNLKAVQAKGEWATTAILNGKVDSHLRSRWDRDGSVMFRQELGLPMTLAAVIPSVRFGGR